VSSVIPASSSNRDLLDRWAACSEDRDGSRHTQTQEALVLARAVESSLSRRRCSPELKKAAREWGATLPDPSAVVSSIAALREAASMDLSRDSFQPDEGSAVPARVLQIIDRVLSEAIEGVSTSLRDAALVDPLTGCANRRALDEDLERAAAGANRTGLDVAVTVIDLDGLKQINDTNGHAAGDSSLRDLAEALRSVVRETDTIYRVGGDEFVVLMPFSGTAAAASTMQRAREQKNAPAFSWGVASLSMIAPGSGVGQLLDLADASLYARRRTTRRSGSHWPGHRRKAAAGAAAAAVIGIGFSSAYVLQSWENEPVIGATAPSGANHSKVEPSRTRPLPKEEEGSPSSRHRGRTGQKATKTAGSKGAGSKAEAPVAFGTLAVDRIGPKSVRISRSTDVLDVATVSPPSLSSFKPATVLPSSPKSKPKLREVSNPRLSRRIRSWDVRGWPPYQGWPQKGWPQNPSRRWSPSAWLKSPSSWARCGRQ
jgi:diguanylate cyclase (GGDEF)-like protein